MKTTTSTQNVHYIHRVRYNYRERMVGLFVFLVLVLFAAFIVISGKSQHLFEQRITFYIDVDSGEGISRGSIIKLLGTEIGEVSDLGLQKGGKVHVAIEIFEGQRNLIRKDAKVIVNRLVTIGSALIEIDPGSIDVPMLEEGATLPVEETPSLNDLVMGIARIIQSADQDLLAKFESILPNLQYTIDNAQKIIAQIATGQGTLGAAVFDKAVEQDLRVVVESGAEILTEAQSTVGVAEQRLIELEPVLTRANAVMQNVEKVSESLPAMVKDLKKSIALTNSALALVNRELQNIPGIGLDARRTLNGADQLLEGVQTSWPLSSVVPKQDSNPLIPVRANDD